MKHIFHLWILIAVLLCVPTSNMAQESKTINSIPDTASINKLIKRAYKLREINTDSAGILYNLALNNSRAIGFRNGIGESLCGLARYYNITNEQQKAVSYIRSAFPYFENNQKGKQLYVSANLLLSESFFYLGAFDSCSFYRYEALNYIENNPIDHAVLKLSVYSKILQFWLNAHEDIKHDKNIQLIMQRINELEKEALAKKDSTILVNIWFQKAGYYHNISQNDSARYYGNKNIELGTRLKVAPSMIMACHLDMALTYIDDKLPLPAIEHIKKAVAAAPEVGKAS
ncbi:MAG: two-component sensor histidine kinase, partial [Sphingobacteriaceae bacterium]